MKRYDSITAIKAVSCFMVFLSHWNGAFASWGYAPLDWLILQSPLRFMTFGNMAVCIFLILSGTLVSLKIYRGGSFSWTSEMLKRYVRMVIPIFGTHLLVYLFLRMGLFRTGEAASLSGNAWLASYYTSPLDFRSVFKCSFVTSVFRGDSTFYGPLWMMNYIFFGTVFSVVLAEGLKGMSRRGKAVFLVILFGIFLMLNSYYLCFLMGNLMAILILWLEKWKENAEENVEKKAEEKAEEKPKGKSKKMPKTALAAGSVLLLLAGIWLALKSFVIGYTLQAKGVGTAPGDPVFWGLMGGFLMIWGAVFLWELFCSERDGFWYFWKRPLLWLGERSYSVFLVHWLVICTFSCGFYSYFINRPIWFYLGINFFATTAVMLLCTEVFYVLIEKHIYAWVWNKVKLFFLRN